MQLCFENSYIFTLWVACAWPNESDCAWEKSKLSGWESGAWWEVKSGETVETNASTGNRYFYYYAESEDGKYWAGRYGPVGLVPGFETCAWIGDESVGMRQVDAGWWHWIYSSYTVNLL